MNKIDLIYFVLLIENSFQIHQIVRLPIYGIVNAKLKITENAHTQ